MSNQSTSPRRGVREKRNSVSVPEARLILASRDPREVETFIREARKTGVDFSRPVVELGGERLLDAAISDRVHPRIIKAMLEGGCPSDYVNGFGETPFHQAIKRGRYDVAVRLAESPDFSEYQYSTFDRNGVENAYFALAVAAANQDNALELLRMLHEYGADPTHKNAHGTNALAYLCAHCERESPNIERVADLLMRAAQSYYGNVDIDGVSRLLNNRDNDERNVTNTLLKLERRIERDDRHVVLSNLLQRFMSGGLEIDILDRNGYTPFLWSCINSQDEIQEMLQCSGANIHTENRRGDTPVFVLAQQGATSALNRLLYRGADPDHFNPAFPDKVPIISAAKAGNWQCVSLLMTYGASVDMDEGIGDQHTLLILAVKAMRGDIVREVLEYGADPNVLNAHGVSPLIYAIWNYHKDPQTGKEVIDALVSNGAFLNTVMHDGRTVVDVLKETGLTEELGQLIYMRNIAYIADNYFEGDKAERFRAAQQHIRESGTDTIYRELTSGAVEDKAHLITMIDEQTMGIREKEKAELDVRGKDGIQSLLALASTGSTSLISLSHVITEALEKTGGSELGAGIWISSSIATFALSYSRDSRENMKIALGNLKTEIEETIIGPSMEMLRNQKTRMVNGISDVARSVATKWRGVCKGLSMLASIVSNPMRYIKAKKDYDEGNNPPSAAFCRELEDTPTDLSCASRAFSADLENDQNRVASLSKRVREHLPPDLAQGVDEEEVMQIAEELKRRRSGASMDVDDEDSGPAPGAQRRHETTEPSLEG